MRGMFGLVGLLVTAGVLVLIFVNIEGPTLRKGKQTQDQAQQISGRGQDGRSAMDSFKVEPQHQGSQLKALLVTDVTPGGAVEEFYGLKKGDLITSITTQAGLQKVGEAANDDPGMAKINVQQAFQGSLPIVVTRGGQQITLPAPAGAIATPPPTVSGTTPPAPAQTPPAAPAAPRNVYDQINNITKSIPGQ